MLKIKLSRIGRKNQPQYRIIVSEARSKRDGAYIEKLGYYNPLTNPEEFNINLKQYQNWLTKGAQPTNTIRRLINKHIKTKTT